MCLTRVGLWGRGGGVRYGEDKKTCSLRKTKLCQIGVAFIDLFIFEILDMAHGEDKKTYPLRKPKLCQIEYGFDLFISFFPSF